MKSYWKPSTHTDLPVANWDNKQNWEPQTIPEDVAAFGYSEHTVVNFNPEVQASINSIEFDENARGYTFQFGSSKQPVLAICGDGIFNNSGVQQSFIIAAESSGYEAPQMTFQNKATAGGNDLYYCVGPQNKQASGGGVLCFQHQSDAGSARFKVWTGAGIPPKQGSTVGGEVAFCDNSSAAEAYFVTYGTLGTDGDTFGNLVFHNNSTAASALVENIGGTVSKGDGGNTQFYDNSTAANGIFHNYGGTVAKANGGDVAIDSTANGGQGMFHNYAAKAAGAYGGVTSFNNNWPHVKTVPAANAAHGTYINYGARKGQSGGGGHLSFSAKYGSPTAANAIIENYGSVLNTKSSAGHTIFSISLPSDYFPSAGAATIYNHPGAGEGCAAGYTEFSIYTDKASDTETTSLVPTAAQATIINRGAYINKTPGGYTSFAGNTSAGEATLIAQSGTQGGYGGKISFYDNSTADRANVVLEGNGELELGYHSGPLSLHALTLTGGIMSIQLCSNIASLNIATNLELTAGYCQFSFWISDQTTLTANSCFTLLTAPNLEQFAPDQFQGNKINELQPKFEITGNTLQVTFI